MLYGREIIGLPVFNMAKKLLGTVKSYEADESGVLKALVITTQGIVTKDLVIPALQIASVSIKGVYLKELDEKLQKAPKNGAAASFLGQVVYDSSGKCMGNICDIMMENKQIYAFELSRGLYDDLCRGRQKVNFAELHPCENGFIKG